MPSVNTVLAKNYHLEQHQHSYNKLATIIVLGLLYLSYPLLGYIADVCLTRYRTIKCSFVFLIVGCTIGGLFYLTSVFVTLTEKFQIVKLSAIVHDNLYTQAIPILLIGTFITTGVGLFEANAIQFGLDQLLEAPTPKLIAFIHWYYWTQNAVQLVVMYPSVGWKPFEAILRTCTSHESRAIRNASALTIAAVLGLVAVSSLVLLHKSKRHLYILRAGLNPFKNIRESR